MISGKERNLFLAGVPGLGHIDRIKLQVWNISILFHCDLI